MTEQEQIKFDNLREMFNTKGWKDFQEDLKEGLRVAVESAPESCLTAETWHFQRGSIAQLKSVLGYQNYIEAVEQQMEEEDASV
jgi:hypothetical protein